jgi:prefoldin subunit 5
MLPQPSKEQELQELKAYAEELKTELEEIKKRIAELEKPQQ